MREAICIGAVLLGLCGPAVFAQSGRAGGEGQTVILEKAPLDHAISIPKEKLAQYLKDMDAKKLQTLRLIEGGRQTVYYDAVPLRFFSADVTARGGRRDLPGETIL